MIRSFRKRRSACRRDVEIECRDALTRGGVDHWRLELRRVGLELDEEIEDFVVHTQRVGTRAVDLVDDHDRLASERQGLPQDEARLRHRSFKGVDDQEDTIDHAEDAFHLAAEVGVARRVDDVDLGAVPYHRSVLGRMVMPRSRSIGLESITRSTTCWFSRNAPAWRSILSTSVVLPWSTCAIIAMLRICIALQYSVGRVTSRAEWRVLRDDAAASRVATAPAMIRAPKAPTSRPVLPPRTTPCGSPASAPWSLAVGAHRAADRRDAGISIQLSSSELRVR